MASAWSDPDVAADREQLLARIQERLESDPTVRGAWLTGSLGRNRTDDLSDIDIWIALDDSAMAEVIASPTAWVGRLFDPVLALVEPANAAPGGAFLGTLVPASTGLQQVDVYWVPASMAQRHQESAVIFERSPIPMAADEPFPSPDELARRRSSRLDLASVMAFITTKRIRRADRWTAINHIRYVAQLVAEIEWMDQYHRIPTHDDGVKPDLPKTIPSTRQEEFGLLSNLVDRIASLAKPTDANVLATLPHLRSWLDRARAAIAKDDI